MPKKLLIEGLLFVPHSYSCVAMWQCIELIKNKTFDLYQNDAPICDWSLKPVAGLLSAEREEALRLIPNMPDPGSADIIYRMDFPHRFDDADHNRLFVFVTAEFNRFPDNHIAGNSSLKEAHLNSRAVIITPSEWSRQRLIENGADSSRITMIPHGVDPSIFTPLGQEQRNAHRKELGWDNNFIFLNCGSMTNNKGTFTLLKSFSQIARRNPHARLCLKGLDSLYSSLSFLKKYKESLTQEEKMSIEGRVSYLGKGLSFTEMAEMYQAADCYVSPYMAEGFNLPVLEATACGTPVICTQGGPTDEFTHPLCTKYIASQRVNVHDHYPLIPDGEHLTHLMQEVIDDPGFRARSATIGPDFVSRKFTWRHVVKKLEKSLLNDQ